MSTTSLFVELVVIGVGALAWVVLLVLSVFGWNWVPTERIFSSVALVPLLSLIYIFGIVTDRIADALFENWWNEDIRKKTFPNVEDYFVAQRLILTRSERFAKLLEYGRSRLRICRGWALNSMLIAIALNIFIWSRLANSSLTFSLSLFGTTACLLFAIASWYTWKKLSVTEYRKMKEQAAFLEVDKDSSSSRK
ncbi:MAG: hypothetical protein ABR556_10125 [Pyrinomonadaceae bacterium]